MRNDEQGAVNILMVVLVLAILVLVAGWYYGILMAILGALLMAVGFLAVASVIPGLKGWAAWLIGLVLIGVGFYLLM